MDAEAPVVATPARAVTTAAIVEAREMSVIAAARVVVAGAEFQAVVGVAGDIDVWL